MPNLSHTAVSRRADLDSDTTGAPPPAHVLRISTRDADQYQAWLTARYSDHQRRVWPGVHGFELLSESAALGSISVIRNRFRGASGEAIWPPSPRIFVAHLLAGRYLTRWDGGEVRLAARGTVLLPPSDYVHFNDCTENSAVALDLDTLLRTAAELTGLDRGQVRFTGLLPVSPMAERQWLATAAYVRHGIYSRGIEHPLLLAAAEQMVAASMLTTFPNTTMTLETRSPRDPATPATVRRAMEFIEANAARPITLTDIARASQVVPRTLQHAFRRHRDISPMAYLRQIRLARAHDALVAAQPGDGTTVAAVATRWGFAPHRFAAVHRQVYGVLPAETLRS